MPARRPHVVAHVAVSLDGATTGFEPDVRRFYELARTWSEDVTLAGADTVLAQEEALAAAPRPGPASDAPLLAVVDGRGRVRQWEALRDCGHWSGVIALRAFATAAPANHGPERVLFTGEERVDLVAVLAMLAEREGAEVVRVDSGGALTGALLDAGLVDELSLLVHPCVVGGATDPRWHGPVPSSATRLERWAPSGSTTDCSGCATACSRAWTRAGRPMSSAPASGSNTAARPAHHQPKPNMTAAFQIRASSLERSSARRGREKSWTTGASPADAGRARRHLRALPGGGSLPHRRREGAGRRSRVKDQSSAGPAGLATAKTSGAQHNGPEHLAGEVWRRRTVRLVWRGAGARAVGWRAPFWPELTAGARSRPRVKHAPAAPT